MPTIDSLPKWPPPLGRKLQFRPTPGKTNPHDATYHVVAVFEDREATYIVVRDWWPRRRQWHYQVLDNMWWSIYTAREGVITVR